MSVSGSSSNSKSNSWSKAAQNVFSEQTPYLTDLWKMGSNTAGQTNPLYQQTLQGGFNQAFGANNPYSQASSELLNPLVSGLTNIMNTSQPTFAAGGSNPLLDKNVALALEQASTDLSRNLLPSIRQDAQAAGQYGGSRQQIAEGLALSDANKNALAAAMGAYGDQYTSDRAANLLSQQQADATRLGAAQQIQNLFGGQSSNLGMGADVAQQMQNMQWNPLMNYAKILGQPIILGSMSSGASSKSQSMGGSAGM